MTTKKLLVLALDRFTDDQVFSWPVKHLGAAVEVYGEGDPNQRIRYYLETHRPDVVVWSGVCGGAMMPRIGTLRWLRERARSVMICWDAGHPDWHPYLAEYRKQETFDAIFAVDGSDTPWCESFLCPINPEWYDGSVSNERPIDLGFMGSFDPDSERGRVLAELGNLVTIKRRTGEPGPYAEYARFLHQCRATVNVAGCAGDQGRHVKARCVEAAWAGCMLFETEGSPLRRFIDQACYFSYANAHNIAATVRCEGFQDRAIELGRRFREAIQPHHPRHFWERVING